MKNLFKRAYNFIKNIGGTKIPEIGYVLVEDTGEKLTYRDSQTGSPCTYSLLYKGAEGTFYVVDNPLLMPYQRKHIFDMIQERWLLGLNKKELLENKKKIREAFNEQDYKEIYHINERELEALSNGMSYQESSELITACYIIQKGETIDYFDIEEARAKYENWRKNPTLLGFFFNIAESKSKMLTASLPTLSPNASESQATPSQTSMRKNKK